MPKKSRRTQFVWVAYSSDIKRYLIITDWKGVKLHDIPVALITVLEETSQEAVSFTVMALKGELELALNVIAEQYGFASFGRGGEMLSAQPQGEWYQRKLLHPLVSKAEDMAWKWFRGLEEKGVQELANITKIKVKLPAGSIRRRNGVSYEGFTNRTLKAHSFDAIHKLTQEAINLCSVEWGWQPREPRMFVHSSSSTAMGIAYNPGKGVHRISLNSKLLNEYDEMSIFRVMLHEFCHHYRDETFPITGDAHDAVFCRELKRVDSVLRESVDPRACIFFTDEKWDGSAVVQKKAARQAAYKQSSSYDPETGLLNVRVLKSGVIKLDWLPREGHTGLKRKAMHAHPTVLKQIAEGMSEKQQKDTIVTWGNDTGYRFLQVLFKGGKDFHLWNFLKGMEKMFPGRGYEGIAK